MTREKAAKVELCLEPTLAMACFSRCALEPTAIAAKSPTWPFNRCLTPLRVTVAGLALWTAERSRAKI